MTSLPDPINILETKGPVTGQQTPYDPAGISAGFSDSPQTLEHRLSYRWSDMLMEVHARNPTESREVDSVRAEVHVGLDSWQPITPNILGERVAVLVNSLAQTSGRMSGLLDILSFGNSPEIISKEVLARFDQVREGTPDDDAKQVASIDRPLPGCGEVPGEILYITSPSEFRIFVPVDRLEKLPEIWREIAARLNLLK
jgi:hypothetical protein